MAPNAPADPIVRRNQKLVEALESEARLNLFRNRPFLDHANQRRPRHAIAPHRGANLDGVDLPLNDLRWYHEQIKGLVEVNKWKDWETKLASIVHRDDLGFGNYYDDLGNPAKQPHLVRKEGWQKNDPAYYHTPQEAFYRGPIPSTKFIEQDQPVQAAERARD